jgi:acetyl-CoA carboxylase carboxyl transferase subunit alpha
VASYVLPFEKPVVELVTRVRELRELAEADRQYLPELKKLEEKTSKVARELFAELEPWQKVQLSRHPNRPYTMDYVPYLFQDFQELHGDRRMMHRSCAGSPAIGARAWCSWGTRRAAARRTT